MRRGGEAVAQARHPLASSPFMIGIPTYGGEFASVAGRRRLMTQRDVSRVIGMVSTVVLAFVALTRAPLAGQVRSGGLPIPLHLSAVAQDLDRGLSTQLRITIDRWSTDRVRDSLMTTLLTNNESKLLDALQHAPAVGTIRTPTSLAWDLHYARQEPGEDGGWRIVLGTDRPIAFSEQWRSSRTLDYPFTVVELHLDNNGEGEGTLSFATKVTADKKKNAVVLENWGTQRTRLTQVKRETE
jgi:hypothetical protein